MLSIKWLFRDVEARELWDAPNPEAAYLWTFTFPDAETRADPKRALRRWASFSRWLNKKGRVCVRSLEVGEKGAWHFHAVTAQRWDAAEIWKIASGYGIGRVDARARPLAAAFYVAKYAGKRTGSRGDMPKGMRRWACVGFKGATANGVRRAEKIREVVRDTGREKLFDRLEWKVGDTVAFTHRYRLPHDGPDETHKMELKPAQVKEVMAKLVGGAICAVGEFRGSQVKSVSWEDKAKPGTRVDRVVVDYQVELGGVGVTVTDWQKPGTKESDVKPSALNRGEPCLVLLETVSWVKGAKKFGGLCRSLPALA